MKSLQAQYAFEREKIVTVENEKYFFNYKMVESEMHVMEMFIAPEFRGSEVTSHMLDSIDSLAVELKASHLVGYVVPGLNFSEQSIVLQIKRGLKMIKCDGEKITMIKEVKHG